VCRNSVCSRAEKWQQENKYHSYKGKKLEETLFLGAYQPFTQGRKALKIPVCSSGPAHAGGEAQEHTSAAPVAASALCMTAGSLEPGADTFT